jgi:hypothetical protein
MSKKNRPVFDSFFWFQWIIATTLGWVLGSLLLPYLSTTAPGVDIAAGVGAGIMQWPVLYRRIPRAWRWPVGTAIAWMGGSLLLLAAVPADVQILLGGVILGPVVGLAQWLILRREVYWAGWWIVISTMAWITGLTLVPGLLATGAMAGALTGVAMSLLLRYPKPVEAPPGDERTGGQGV